MRINQSPIVALGWQKPPTILSFYAFIKLLQIIGPVVDITSGDRIPNITFIDPGLSFIRGGLLLRILQHTTSHLLLGLVGHLMRGLVTKQTGGVIINALGEPVDDVGSLLTNIRCLESPAPDIICRVSLHEPFATDITSIIPVPVGNGTLGLFNVMCDSKVIVQDNLAESKMSHVYGQMNEPWSSRFDHIHPS